MTTNRMELSILIYLFCIMYLITSSYFMKWLIMELVTLIFVIYLNLEDNKSIGLIYFVISVISGFSLIFVLAYKQFFLNYEVILNYVSIFMLFMKLGVFPFTNWVIYMYDKMSWDSIFLSSTIMKFMPMMIMFDYLEFNSFIFWLIMFNSLYSSFYSFYSFNLKTIIACSSMSHLSFFLVVGLLDKLMFIIFIFIYFVILKFLIYLFKLDYFVYKNNLLLDKILMFMTMVNYMMFPPFMSMMYKWFFMLLNMKFLYGSKLFMVVFLFSSLLLSYNYFKMVEKSFFENNYYKFWVYTDLCGYLIKGYLILILYFYMVNLIINSS